MPSVIAAAIALLFAAACVMPVSGDPEPEYIGVQALLFGWMLGIPWSNLRAGFPSVVPWFANWILFAGWTCLRMRRFKAAAKLGALASMLAFTTWLTALPRLLAGYYLWHSSMIVLMLGAVACDHRMKRQRSTTVCSRAPVRGQSDPSAGP